MPINKFLERRRREAFSRFMQSGIANGDRLDLGGLKGQNEGFTSVNIFQPCDIEWDLDRFPYPFKNNSAGAVVMASTLQHLKDPKLVMQEVWRICKPNAKVFVTVPYWKYHTILYNPGHYHDFRMEWFRNLNEDNPKLVDETTIGCNFRLIDHWYMKGRIRPWARWRG